MKYSNFEEIKRSCEELGVSFVEFESAHAAHFIEAAFAKFKPFRKTGHLQIGERHGSLELDQHEFTYSERLDGRPICIVLDQLHYREHVVQILDSRRLCDVIGNSYGVEYFAIDAGLRFMFSVCWYVVEFSDPEGTLASLGFSR